MIKLSESESTILRELLNVEHLAIAEQIGFIDNNRAYIDEDLLIRSIGMLDRMSRINNQKAKKIVERLMKDQAGVYFDDEIEQAFVAKGYQLVGDAEKADFAISYSVGNRDKIKVSNFPSSYNSYFGWGRGYYGGMFGAHINTDTHVRQYTEGKLAIDVYDVKTHQPAWHGWAIKRLSTSDKEAPSSMIKDVVDEVVAQFN